ncbi:putative serine protease inhibitor [Namao virus]|nr:putative serine protease inhibitor [Namao virus]
MELSDMISKTLTLMSEDIGYDETHQGCNVVVSPISLLTVSNVNIESEMTDKDKMIVKLIRDMQDFATQGSFELTNDTVCFFKIHTKIERNVMIKMRAYCRDNVLHIDFNNDLNKIIADINNWVYDKTRGIIPCILARGDLSYSLLKLIINVIYFRGTWFTPFDIDDTYQTRFWLDNNQTTTVPMMRQEMPAAMSVYNVYDHKVTVAHIPYQNWECILVVMFTEDKEGLETLESKLDSKTMEMFLDHDDTTIDMYNIHLPRFEMRATVSLNRLSDQPNDMTKIMHQCYIKVDENGTTACAVSSIQTDGVCPYPQIKVDRPFLFCVKFCPQNIPLFYGKCVNPSL